MVTWMACAAQHACVGDMCGVLAWVMWVGWAVHLHGWRVRVSDVPWIFEFKVIFRTDSEPYSIFKIRGILGTLSVYPMEL